MPQRIYNPITAMGFSSMFTSQLYIILRGKHCRRPIAVMGVVDTLGLRRMCKLSVCTINLTLGSAMLLTSYFTFLQFSQNIFGSLNCPQLNIKTYFLSNPAPHRSIYTYSKFICRKAFWSIVASEQCEKNRHQLCNKPILH